MPVCVGILKRLCWPNWHRIRPEFKESGQKLHFYHRFYFEKAGCAFVTMPQNTGKSLCLD